MIVGGVNEDWPVPKTELSKTEDEDEESQVQQEP